MKLVVPPMTIEADDGFKNDALGRSVYGEALLNLVTSTDDELVVALNGRWGEGKTTFVKMWQGLLREKGVASLYIDAFAGDYSRDAFVFLASAISAYVEENLDQSKKDKLDQFKAQAAKVGTQLLSWTAKVGIKAVTLGVLRDADIEELTDIKDDFSGGISGVVGDLIKSKIGSYAEELDSYHQFRELLSSIPECFGSEENGPFVIIIDELDRCRPDFAVEIVEVVKHFYSVQNVVFLYVMNRAQMEASIRCIYGTDIDAHNYLQKFITLETRIPKRTLNRYHTDCSSYSKHLFEAHQLNTWGEHQAIVGCLESLSGLLDLSLRQLEKVFTNLVIFYGASTKDSFRILPIVVFVAVVKVVRPNLFDRLLNRSVSFDALCNEVSLDDGAIDRDVGSKLEWIRKWLRFALLSTTEFDALPENDELRGYYQPSWTIDGRIRENIVSSFCQILGSFGPVERV